MSILSTPLFTTETITPDMARAILENNTTNRKPSPRHIAKLAMHMTNGTFLLTGDAIRIGIDGTLYDGQHRLMACVQADVPFTTLVARNLQHDTLRVIDGGISRSKQQQLKIADGIDPIVTNTVLMLCRFAVGAHYDATLNTALIHAIIERHPAITTTAMAYKDATAFGMGANLPAAELILRANGYHEEAKAWRDVWANGYISELGKGAFYFREALIRDNDKETGKTWGHVARRKLLTQNLLKTFAGVHTGPRVTTGGGYLFTGVDAQSLLTSTDFETTIKTPARRITNQTEALQNVKTSQRRMVDRLATINHAPALPFEDHEPE